MFGLQDQWMKHPQRMWQFTKVTFGFLRFWGLQRGWAPSRRQFAPYDDKKCLWSITVCNSTKGSNISQNIDFLYPISSQSRYWIDYTNTNAHNNIKIFKSNSCSITMDLISINTHTHTHTHTPLPSFQIQNREFHNEAWLTHQWYHGGGSSGPSV